MSRPMRLRHASGTATATPERVSVNRGIGVYLRIVNTDGANGLDVSFDGGRNFTTIFAVAGERVLQTDALFHFFFVRSTGLSTTWNAVIGEG